MELEQIVVAYSAYYATGEGVTIHIAIGGSENHAVGHFRENVPDYFQAGLKIRSWTDEDDEFESVKEFVPPTVIDLLTSNPKGSTEWFSVTHYNLS